MIRRRRIIRRKRVVRVRSTAPAAQPSSQRALWKTAEDSRNMPPDWNRADANTYNENLQANGDTLRRRIKFELQRNSAVKGVQSTFTDDLIGPEGPGLQIVVPGDPNSQWAQTAEDLFNDWWAAPDYFGRLTGPELLRLGARGLFPNGEFIAIETNAERAQLRPDLPLRLRLQLIDPVRVKTPYIDGVTDNIVLGIKLSESGIAQTYFVDQPVRSKQSVGYFGNFAEVPADRVRHVFIAEEEEQVRGIPLLATALHDAALLRAYDEEHLAAARKGTNLSIFAHTNNPQAEFVVQRGTRALSRNSLTHVAPGWDITSVDPRFPATNYAEFRKEQLRGLGRALNMPLIKVLADSSDSNYSASRQDLNGYKWALRSMQNLISSLFLTPVLESLLTEAILHPQRLLGTRPPRYRVKWSWPQLPHVDPQKETQAVTEALEAGVMPYQQAVNETSRGMSDWVDTLEQMARERDKREELGLPQRPGVTAKPPAPAIANNDGDDNSDDNTEADNDRRHRSNGRAR